jgi:hypothetical protein
MLGPLGDSDLKAFIVWVCSAMTVLGIWAVLSLICSFLVVSCP